MIAATALSLRSTHPVSTAIVKASVAMGIDAGNILVDDFVLTPGGGVQGTVYLSSSPSPHTSNNDGNSNTSNNSVSNTTTSSSSDNNKYSAWFGSLDFISDRLTPNEREILQQQRTHDNALQRSILSILVLEPTINNNTTNNTANNSARTVCVFAFEDSLRSASADSIKILQQGSWANGISSATKACSVVMLTGDSQVSADRVATQVGIKTVYAQLSPEDKLDMIAQLRSDTSTNNKDNNEGGVIMIGDGLNDAAALAAANVGIAIASPTVAAASLSADAIVMNEHAGVSVVPFLLRVARATKHVLYQNIALAAGSIAVLALPTVLGFIPLWVAVLLHEGSTLLVALNSLRLLRFSSGMMFTTSSSSSSSSSDGYASLLMGLKESDTTYTVAASTT